MSNYRISLAFSVFHYYLNGFAEKHQFSLPSFPKNLQLVDVLPFVSQAETIVLGKQSSKKYFGNESLFSLFENISLKDEHKPDSNIFSYEYRELSANSIFSTQNTASSSLFELWNKFTKGIEKIPTSHQENLNLWLDHFDTAMQCFMSQIPSPYSRDISFYDFTKAVSAFVVALSDNLASKEEPLLLVQGDFFGIQDFIFSGGRESNKGAAKILRGRSFQVSLFTELAALKVLNACGLPATSQVMNAAGKLVTYNGKNANLMKGFFYPKETIGRLPFLNLPNVNPYLSPIGYNDIKNYAKEGYHLSQTKGWPEGY